MKNFYASLIIVISFSFSATLSYGQSSAVSPTKVSKAVYFDKTGPIINLPVLTDEEFDAMVHEDRTPNNESLEFRQYNFQEMALPKGQDPARQSFMGKSPMDDNLIISWVGQASPYYPTDVNGTPGTDYYLQTINCVFAIYNKSDGEKVFGPTAINELFEGVPGSNNNDGDPIVLYDDEADRWLVSEFSISTFPYYMLIAISETNDPLGSWYRWSFEMNGFPDYEKYGVWRDGYYMGTNTYSGDDIYVFEREKMLLGDAEAQMVQFENPWRPQSGFHMVPPADNDGPLAPDGEPGIFITINDDAWNGGTDELWLFELDVDWETPGNSSFDRVQQIEVAPFSSMIGDGWTNITQPGTNQKLDGIMQVLMNKPQYRNFGDHQTIVACHTVDFSGNDEAGVRWYELNKTDGDWFIRQQGTYAPDNHNRWMGSIAMNEDHEIALGYSISSSTEYPGVRFTGQSATEYATASGIMDIPEESMHNGTLSQNMNRWGDYSSMDVDFADKHTFWYTSQILGPGGSRKTKIGAFKFSAGGPLFANFTSDLQVVADACQVNFQDISTGTPVSWEWTFEGGIPSTSDQQHPSPVTYEEPGLYEVSLTITDLYGSHTKTETNYILVDDTKTPDINFEIDNTFICSNDTIKITDLSLNCPNSWEWSFYPETYEFANGTNANSINPEVVFFESINYDIIVQVSNNNGSSSEVFYDFIKVGGTELPVFNDFESGTMSTNEWKVENPDGSFSWEIAEISSGEEYGNFAAMMNFYRYNGGLEERDRLISPPMDLSKFKDASLSFDHAFASRFPGYSDSLFILVSTDCGESWEQLLAIGEDDNGSFATAEASNDEFYPASSEDWCDSEWGASCIEIDLTPYAKMNSVKIAFESFNLVGNNLFIDNIMIDGNLDAIEENPNPDFVISPNPASDKLFISSKTDLTNAVVEIFDTNGRKVLSEALAGLSEKGIDVSTMPAGIYLISITGANTNYTEKIIIQ